MYRQPQSPPAGSRRRPRASTFDMAVTLGEGLSVAHSSHLWDLQAQDRPGSWEDAQAYLGELETSICCKGHLQPPPPPPPPARGGGGGGGNCAG